MIANAISIVLLDGYLEVYKVENGCILLRMLFQLDFNACQSLFQLRVFLNEKGADLNLEVFGIDVICLLGKVSLFKEVKLDSLIVGELPLDSGV